MRRRDFIKGGIAAGALLAANPLKTFGSAAKSPIVPITFFHTNDTHAHILPFKRRKKSGLVGGISHLASLVKKVRAKEPNSLLLSAGDVFQGTLFYNFFKGEVDFKCMNYIGYDAMCLGNHEFDDYQERLAKTLKIAKFPVLSANLNFSDTAILNELVLPFTIKNVAGVNIGIIGLTTDDLFILTNPKYLKGVIVNDLSAVLSLFINILKPKVDIIVLLSHIGISKDLELAAMVDGVDVIIGGHTHTPLKKPIIVKNQFGKKVVVNQAGEWSEYLGRVKIEYNLDTKSWSFINGELIPVVPECGSISEIDKIVKKYNDKIGKESSKVIGITKNVLVGTKEVCRRKESNLGNLLADAVREHYNTDMGFCNGGGIRSSILGPEITIKSALEAFPFDNMSIKLTLKGKQIVEAFKYVAKKMQGDPFGGFLQVSGCKVTYEKGELKSLLVNGKPIDSGRTYTVAMSDFMAAGGDGFTMFKDVPQFLDGTKINDIMIDFIKNHTPLNYKVEGRIVVK